MKFVHLAFAAALAALLFGCGGTYQSSAQPSEEANSGSIIGSVWDQFTGQPIMGAVVRLAGTNYSATTDADGVFVIDDVPIGQYQLITSYFDYGLLRVNGVPVRPGQSTRVDEQIMKGESEYQGVYSSSVIRAAPQKKAAQPATPPVQTKPVVIGEKKKAKATEFGSISGIVTDSATSFPIVGASVIVVGTQNGAMTDVDGKYTIAQVQVGIATLKITHIDYRDLIIPNVIVKDSAMTTVNRSLQQSHRTGAIVQIPEDRWNKSGSIIGHVTDSLTGKPLRGVLVQVDETALLTKSSADGRYEIPNVPVGAHRISVKLAGYAGKDGDAVIVKSGEMRFDIKLKRLERKREREKSDNH